VVSIAVAKPLPPPDRDGDTIPDARDACPDEPEDLDQFEDDDGCVDRDNDGDNIPDAHEWKDGRWTNCDFRMADGIEVDCRNLPEDFDDNDDLDGCPEFVSYDGPAPLVTLHYRRPGRLSAAELAPLDQVARRLREEPELRAWIDAHVDRQRDQKAAKRISRTLAETVLAALVERGVAGDRLEPRGMGDQLPAAAGNNARRVEIFLRDGCDSGGPCRREILCQ